MRALAVAVLLASGAAAQPTSEPSDQQRLKDFLALLESPNGSAARRTGARELLRLEPERVRQHVLRALQSSDPMARIAIAAALSDLPEAMQPEYVPPLIEMLGHEQDGVREAAVHALSRSATRPVIEQLAALLQQPGFSASQRAAIQVLSEMMTRDALAVLVQRLGHADEQVGEACLDALRFTTGQPLRNGRADALAWWDRVRELPRERWQQMQMRRLAERNHAARQQLRDLEARLTATMREAYFRLPEPERDAALRGRLTDSVPALRLLGLELVQSRLTEGRTVPDEAIALVRNLLTDPEAGVRAAAARTVTALRNPSDASRLTELVSSETDAEARHALINGLGYLGSEQTVAPLVALLEHSDPGSADEAAGALGRLAERGVLTDEARGVVANALLARFEQVRGRNGSEVRVLSALGRLGDGRCRDVFIDVLSGEGSAPARLAALRGATALLASAATAAEDGAAILAAMTGAAGDQDVALRRLALDALARHGSAAEHLSLLWERAFATSEPDEAARKAAWAGVLRLLEAEPVDRVLAQLERLAERGDADAALRPDLLQIAVDKLADPTAAPQPPKVRGRLRVELAAIRAANGELDAAISLYCDGLGDLAGAGGTDVSGTAADLARLTLLHRRYDDAIAKVISGADAAVDGEALFEQLQAEIESRVNPASIGEAVEIAQMLASYPPDQFSESIRRMAVELVAQTLEEQQRITTEQVNAALARLRQSPADVEAREQIARLGKPALPALTAALRDILQAPKVDLEAERRLHDLIREIDPEWPGFRPDMSVQQKLQVLARMSA